MTVADCRWCRHFIHIEALELYHPELLEKAYSQAALRGERPLGWCRHFNRVVTYYTGKCRAYTRRTTGRQLTITDFLEAEAGP